MCQRSVWKKGLGRGQCFPVSNNDSDICEKRGIYVLEEKVPYRERTAKRPLDATETSDGVGVVCCTAVAMLESRVLTGKSVNSVTCLFSTSVDVPES